jgi:SfnB family sulfur acquisition oxidoreductase
VIDAAVDVSAPDDVPVIASDEEAVAAAAAFARAIAPGAVQRDADAAMPVAELRELARTGLLGMRVPARFGGAGVRAETVAEVFRLISAADPAIGQIPQNHVQFADTLIRYGSPAQHELFLPRFLRGERLGNALSERGGRTARDWSTRLRRSGDGGYRLNGRKYYSTGALTAQWIPVFALEDDGGVAIAYVPRDAPGVSVDQDWNAFGQRGTFSGTTVLDDVAVAEEWILRRPFGRAEADTHAAFGQLMHASVDVGIARGALDDGVAFLRDRARPSRETTAGRAADEPPLISLVGELDVRVRAAEALLSSAARAIDRADAAHGARADADAVTHARLETAAAKALGGEIAVSVSSAIFDLAGSSAADRRHGLDRHWRNARTHTLHDPARTKHLHLGRFAIDGTPPPAGEALI